MAPEQRESAPPCGGCVDLGTRWELIASTQVERIKEEMIVATLDSALMAQERSLANYMLKTRRPELFGELVREQTSC